MNLLSFEELDPATRIALAYAPAPVRAGFAGIFLLDHVLRHATSGGREPMLKQIRLAWWRDELARLANEKANPPHPVLRHLAHHWRSEAGALAALVDAWEELATGNDFAIGAERVAKARGEAMASLAPGGAHGRCLEAAQCWSRVDLAGFAPDLAVRESLLTAAAAMPPVRLPAILRPLAVLDGLARRSLKRGGAALMGDRLSPLAAMRLGIFGR